MEDECVVVVWYADELLLSLNADDPPPTDVNPPSDDMNELERVC